MGKLHHQPLPAEVLAAARHLQRAYEYAPKMQVDAWVFAVPLRYLVELGVDESDLRWLVLEGLAEHAREITTFRDVERHFRPSRNVAFTPQTCFVLTKAGAELLHSARQGTVLSPSPAIIPFPTLAAASDAAAVPHWDCGLHVLRVGGQIVKQYRQPAENQETVLTAFEESRWRPCIDDPLPPRAEQESKHRLNRTIERLNKHQCRPLLRFFGDGSGQAVCWEPLGAAALKIRRAG